MLVQPRKEDAGDMAPLDFTQWDIGDFVEGDAAGVIVLRERFVT